MQAMGAALLGVVVVGASFTALNSSLFHHCTALVCGFIQVGEGNDFSHFSNVHLYLLCIKGDQVKGHVHKPALVLNIKSTTTVDSSSLILTSYT